MKKLFVSILLAGSFHATAGTIQNAPLTQSTQRTVVINVQEMNCQLCVYLVNKELRAINGVISTKGSIKTGRVSVVTNNNVTNEQLLDAIKKLKYTPSIVK